MLHSLSALCTNSRPLDAKRPKIGIQITGFFFDSFSSDLSARRTSNGNTIARPRLHSLEKLLEHLRLCGADVLVYHLNPRDPKSALACNSWAKTNGFDLLLNNESPQITGPATDGWPAWVWDIDFIHQMNEIKPLYGLLHDEIMHHQIHPGIEGKTFSQSAICDTREIDKEEEAYKAVSQGLKRHVDHAAQCGSRFVTEEVIPIMYHSVARAGGIPGCKVLKEQNSVLSLTLAMSAAWQYGSSWMACIDLWEGDSGPWYQILSGFAGHSPEEFRSALEMTYLLNPECLYVESADILWQADHPEAPLTEFGRQLASFHREMAGKTPPLFQLEEWTPEIAIIHVEDGGWGIGPWPQYGLLGSHKLPILPKHLEWIKIWYHLMWGHADPARLWEYPNPFEEARRKVNLPGGDELNIHLGPRPDERTDPRREESRIHSLFHPLNNAVVLDQFVESKHLEHAKLIFVTGSYAPERIWPIVEKRVAEGATCLCQADIAPARHARAAGSRMGAGNWWTIGDFLSLQTLEVIMPFRGASQQWRLKMRENELRFFATDPWANRIDWEYQ
jgi:hypothetical protein